ncbi:TRAP transporter permease [Gelria sp. Kuro-4]|uniref:TRAP transporter permease n=1 Tax=Gelria sp. Kuro-4 TaxID=2796927 RepID=UPI001BEEF5FD|nr:TRAP transporter permease [Gelria sp. Kuro-4]BCV24515.1 C4-dicarboxylate ABC transporter [Gelria sp. Kuro-4]
MANDHDKFSVESMTEQNAINLDELVKKYDTESRFRSLAGWQEKVASAVAILLSAYLFVANYFGNVPSTQLRSAALGLSTFLVFMLYPASGKASKTKGAGPVDVLLALISSASILYLFVNYNAIATRGGFGTTTDQVVGAVAMILLLEAGRRIVGKELSIMAIVFMLYAYLGPHLPSFLAHRGYPITRLIDHMYISSEGIFGIPLGVAATYIFLFILFGSFLQETGLGEMFTNLAIALAGGSPGGPAKVAVVASGLLGMINGSAAANVVTTGTFTIPLMKSVGYKPHFAGAVEAVASTGGQIMPPVMGAAAFIMAEFLNIPYGKVMLAAAIPAFLYYLAVFVMVHLEARRLGLQGLPRDRLPDVWKILRERGHLLVPIVLLMYMLIRGYTPIYAANYSIFALIAVSFLRRETRITWKGFLKALEGAARGSLSVTIACGVVGFVVGVISLTGLGLMAANYIITLAGGVLFFTLVLTMVASIILGMGLPTSACYIVTATVAVPALVKMGVAPIAAHLFALYFGCLSAITPPVALAAYAGAGIAGANPSKVGWTATRLGIAGFLIPFIFVYSPVLLLENATVLQVLWSVLTASVGVVSLGASVIGFMYDNLNKIQRLILFATALLLIDPGLLTDSVGIGLLLVIYLWQRRKKARSVAASV